MSDIVQFAPEVGTMIFFGAIIGFFCRGRWLLQLILCIVVSIGFWMIRAWIAGTFSDEFSLVDPMGALYWGGLPYVYFLLLPILLSSSVIGWLRRARAT